LEDSAIQNQYSGLSRIKLFWSLSRTPHGLLDMSTPALGALLWLGAFPPLNIIILGIITVFAGYTAVYAWNDVIDYRVDQEKARFGSLHETDNYLDAVLPRHPMAQGLLSLREGMLWALGWSLLAIVGAYLLNPVCVLIFVAGCVLEAIYCLMLKVTPFRTLVSGGVKTSGAIAAVFAVDPHPSFSYVLALFLWLFFWEIGGQNLPADWADIEEDRQLQAKTIPVRLGTEYAALILLGCIFLALAMNIFVFYYSSLGINPPVVIACLITGVYLLLLPAFRTFMSKKQSHAMGLFNKASYYPLAMLVVVVIYLLI
jgi:4-hydroxybenzoate polyprenyltransferase